MRPGTACIAGATHIVFSESFGTIPPHAIAPLVLAGYSLPLCANILVTSLIVYRIWYMSFPLPNSPQIVAQATSRRAMMLVIESGALYLFIQLVYVVVFALASPAKPLTSVVAIQIYVRLSLVVLFLLNVILPLRIGHRTESHCRWYRTWHLFGTFFRLAPLYVGRPSWPSIRGNWAIVSQRPS